MCLVYGKKNTLELKKSKKKEFTFYKIYRYNCSTSDHVEIVSAYKKTGVTFVHMKNDLGKTIKHISDRKDCSYSVKGMTDIEKVFEYVYYGIHVFVNKADAEKEASEESQSSPQPHLIVVPVKCKKKDLIAGGIWDVDFSTKQAVFNEVEVNMTDIINAISEKENKE